MRAAISNWILGGGGKQGAFQSGHLLGAGVVGQGVEVHSMMPMINSRGFEVREGWLRWGRGGLGVMAGVLLLLGSVPTWAAALWEPKPGEHVALIGNGLPDRMQHTGYFETLLHARYPEHDLVVRNLAVVGDEVVTRHRSENFGTPDAWLRKVQADVILAFFGFNESFRGEAELGAFRTELRHFVDEVRSQDYSGRGKARLILVSPIALERHRDPNFRDPEIQQGSLARYAAAMAEVAREAGVPFVDLFGPSQALYREASEEGRSLTLNGYHLTGEGDRRLAPVLFRSLVGENPPTGDFEKLRAAVNEKNWQWHQRYRTVDGYNVFGGRSALAYRPDQGGFISDRQAPEPYISNYRVMQEEMSQRDVMTANRDRRVWAVARGGDLVVDDSNLPAVTPVASNLPGPGPDNTHVYLDGEAAMAKMKVHSGMKVNLFASEKEFPELINPVQMAWDTRGRLWVAVWPHYPGRRPTSPTGDSLIILEDTDGDGRADKSTTFIDDLNAPTGFQFFKDGVLLMQAPDFWWIRDTDGDGRADWKERVLMGMDSADSHHTANAICLDPGGAMYLSDGVFHRTQVETAWGPVRNNDGAIYRFEPRTGKFETYISYGFANPHGRVFDAWGNDLVTDATGNNTYFGPAISGYLDYPAKHAGIREFWNRPSRPCPATGILTSRHFPEEFQGNFLNLNVIGFRGIFRVNVLEEGSGLRGETLEHLIESSDPNFRPIAIATGPDGAIYFADWHQAIIGHMQHHLRDPNRDHQHGRVYRITYEGRPLLPRPAIYGQPMEALLDLLKEPENQVREWAKLELDKHDSKAVTAAVKQWVAGLDRNHPNYEHQMMEALWVHQWHHTVEMDLLRRMLRSPEPRARAAAGRVLWAWREQVPEALAWFRVLALDEHPRVRLEAVRAASYFQTAEAADLALEVLRQPMDYYLEYTLRETLRQLEPVWRRAIAEGQPIASRNPAGLDYLVGRLTTAELLRLPRTAGVLEALVTRPDAADADRAAALLEWSRLQKKGRVALVLETLDRRGASDPAVAAAVARLLPLQLPEELQPVSARLEALAREGSSTGVRQAAWAAQVLADEGFGSVWTRAAGSARSLADLLGGIPLLPDPELRARAYDRVLPLLSSVPAGWDANQTRRGAVGRFVRVELPRRGTLTLAEVEVMSGGRNVARGGTAKQSSTGHGGEAARAIDGKTQGDYASGTQTHTVENQPNPWWEVDLGGMHPIDEVVVWNRTEGDLSQRLDGFTVRILDAGRQEIWKREGNAAPAPSVRLAAGGDPVGQLRQSAIRALVSMNHEPAAVFGALARLVEQGEEVVTAAQGLRMLPRSAWPREAAGTAATALGRWAKAVPAEQRTSMEYVETVQFADDLAGFLPADRATALRRGLRELRVPVFVIRTVREQMRFDTPRLVVEAGKPFEILFENADFMPHNLLIVRPGTRDRVGTMAAVMRPDDLDAAGRAFVPSLDAVLAGTKMLVAGERETLKLTAPVEEGEYEYVCTFPGHHQVMWGWLIVTKDVDGYLERHPEARPAGTGAADDEHSEFH